MGAWDVTAFGNDEASDMVWDLLEQPNPQHFLARILDHAHGTGYMEAPEGSQVVAAAAIVAAAIRFESVTVPDHLASWIQSNKSMLRPLVPAALTAMERVRGDQSELRESWRDSDEDTAWLAELDVISSVLRLATE